MGTEEKNNVQFNEQPKTEPKKHHQVPVQSKANPSNDDVVPLLEWDKTSEKFYETGVERGVLYLASGGAYGNGVAWNGLTKVSEKPTGAEVTSLWANNAKYVNMQSAEEFEASIEAYTYPDEFAECDGSKEIKPGLMIGQQERKPFGLCYRTEVGNDTDGNSHAYKLHIVYGATCSPSEKDYSTINDSPEAITFSWEMKTTPVNVTGGKPTSLITIDSRKADETKLANLEQVLYGKPAGTDPTTDPEVPARLPLPDEIVEILG